MNALRLTEDKLKQIFTEGYDAGWEFHLGTGIKADNPYWYGGDYEESKQLMMDTWQNGFDLAGDDS